MDSTRLAQVRQQYYLSTRKQVESILGGESKELKHYRGQYEKELSQSHWSSSDQRHFIKRIKSAEVVLVGDFHPLKQSSRALLRLIRKETESSIVLALECFDVQDQPVINQYVSGKISEKDFLKAIKWKKKWGFPWENYRPLLKWAQLAKAEVYALSDFKVQNLKKRDQKSAQVIQSIREKNPKAKIYVQYGDLHLAMSHLPKEIRKLSPKIDLCVVFQSPEIIYFKIMEKQKDHLIDVVRLNDDKWALNNMPPWVKWQDYLLYLESGQDRRVKVDDHDITDRVSHMVQLFNQSFGFNVGLAALSVYAAHDDQFFNLVDQLPRGLKAQVLEQVKDGGSFFVPEFEAGYLTRHSINHVARIAAQYLYHQLGFYKKSLIYSDKDFLRLIWLEMVVYLCIKVANPKRKTDTLLDIRMALQKEQFDDRGKEALSIALTQKLSEMQFLSNGQIKTRGFKIKASAKSIQAAAQILGSMMGEKFYSALNKKIIQLPKNKNLIFKDLQSDAFTEMYYESLEMIESWPEGFKSKFDKL